MEEQNVAEPQKEEGQKNEEVKEVTPEPVTSNSDVEKNKALAIVGYIIPLLFFVPLVSDAKDSAFAKFHANQHLILLISWLIISVLGSVPFLGWFFILPLGMVFLIVLSIIGLISASQGEMKEIPLIGSFKIIN
ncbi:MAG: DUF4870 domain-containing protein [Candidatus Moranbacteria bacterium]|jgi:uncharacterized membrane protein|nr:DUF4870 domain-containing protein [Candidatus Moranbacteria bacterium]